MIQTYFKLNPKVSDDSIAIILHKLLGQKFVILYQDKELLITEQTKVNLQHLFHTAVERRSIGYFRWKKDPVIPSWLYGAVLDVYFQFPVHLL